MQLSLVIPLYNEEESLEQLHREICEVAEANDCNLEIIFIDDGSTDNSWAVVEKIIVNDSRVRGIQFRRNFGKAVALHAGFKVAKGEYVMTLDADLQDDPKEIPDFFRLMNNPEDHSSTDQVGFDVVSGWKQQRYDPWHKVLPSRVFNGMVSWMTGVKLHDHNCGMKCYRREVLNEVNLYGERHRFIPVLAASRGFKIGEKVVAHRPRQFGKSKYGIERLIKGFLDLLTIWFLTRYGQRPQHFFGTMALIVMTMGFIAFVIQCIIFVYRHIKFYSSIEPCGGLDICLLFQVICSMAIPYLGMPILAGILFFALGFVAELFVSKTIQTENCYSVNQATNV